MATASLKSVFGGGDFFPEFFSGGLTIPAGASGNILTITPPAGKKVRLIGLCLAPSFVGNEPGITITTSYGVVVSSLSIINTPNTVGCFNVGFNMNSAGFPNSAMGIPYIESDGDIVVSKSGGPTSALITYSYVFGT